MATKVLERGNASPTVANAYADTVANYNTGGGGSTGDNTIENVTCDPSVYIGAVVRMNGSTAINALADSTTNSAVIGICVSKPSSTLCNIQTCGFTDNILSGLTVGTRYFLSHTVAGKLTTTIPTGTGTIVLFIGKALTSQQLIIQIGPGIRRS